MREVAIALPIGSVAVDDGGRIRAAPGPVVAGIGPDMPGLGLAAAGVEDRRGVLVGEQARRRFDDLQHALVDHRQSRKVPLPTQSASVAGSRAIPWRA